MIKLGKLYPSFDTNPNVRGVIADLVGIRESFDDCFQTLMNSGRIKPTDVWRRILKGFHLALKAIEAVQATAITSETTSGPAKPRR
jgi:hypothetical protein